MQYNIRWITVGLLLACLQLVACSQSAAPAEKVVQARVEQLNGAEPARVTLTAEAAKRLDIQTAAITNAQVKGVQRTLIPYGAVLYDTEGKTWAYINTKPLTYVRHSITVESITGDQAVLTDGPPAGTLVVTVGAEELFGSESEFKEG